MPKHPPRADDIPEDATEAPPIRTPDQDARRATERAAQQEEELRPGGDGDVAPRWPAPEDPLRQPGELSPAPEHRRRR